MRADRQRILAHLPSFGSRTIQAMTYREISNSELTERLRAFGLRPADTYVYDLTSVSSPPNPTLFTIAGLRDALGISAEWWFDPSLTESDLPRLDLLA